jgi:hypothetical protein
LINSYTKLLLIALFATVFTIACAIIIYIQAVHGTPINIGKGVYLQSNDGNATLIVIKNVTHMPLNESDPLQTIVGAYALILSANNFIMHVNGNNPSPFESAGSESWTNVSIGQGPYVVTETKPLLPNPFQDLTRESPAMAFSANYSKDCTGTIKDREIKTCKIIDTLS